MSTVHRQTGALLPVSGVNMSGDWTESPRVRSRTPRGERGRDTGTHSMSITTRVRRASGRARRDRHRGAVCAATLIYSTILYSTGLAYLELTRRGERRRASPKNETAERTRILQRTGTRANENTPRERRNGEPKKERRLYTRIDKYRAGMGQRVQGFPREALALSHSHSKATAKADV